MTLAFSTKAGTLALLQDHLQVANIAPLVCFTVADWNADRDFCLREIAAKLSDGPWIIRSSCQCEDSASASNAGAFLSLPDIDIAGLADAIERVIAAYGAPGDADEVLVQPMLKDVVRSGVAFSHDPNTCAPYRVVNWSDGGDTAAVTGGLGGRTWQQAAQSPVAPPMELAGVFALLEELLSLFGNTPVDCEFAYTASPGGGENLWLLQARPLVLARNVEDESTQAARLNRILDKVARGMQPHPFLIGRRTV